MGKKKHNKHKKSRGEPKGDMINLKGKNVLPFIAPSASGAWVGTRIEIDTDLLSKWQTMGGLYQYWRIRSLAFKYIPTVGTQNIGTLTACMIEDPYTGTIPVDPANESEVITQRVSKIGTIRDHMTLHWKPEGPANKWLFTRDLINSDDRLEMPGDFFYATSNCTLGLIPGRWILNYWLQFKGQTNAIIGDPLATVKYITKQTEDGINQMMKNIATDLKLDKGVELDLEKLFTKYNLKLLRGVGIQIQKPQIQQPTSEISSPQLGLNNNRIIMKFP